MTGSSGLQAPLGVPKDPLGVPKGVQWWGTNFYLCPECMGIHLAPFTAAETVKNAEIEGKNGLMAPEAFRGPRPEKK